MYAQNCEDDLIFSLVPNCKPEESSFIDIGAYDGITRSNTYVLAKHGWSGILVEPSPSPFQKLLELYQGNPRTVLVNAALGRTNSVVEFWPSEDGVSTTVKSHFDKWKNAAQYQEKIIVRQISFAGLYQMARVAFCSVCVLSIDTEGSSVDVLETFPFKRIRPLVVCVEHDGLQKKVLSLLVPLGYKLKTENSENMVLYRDKSTMSV